MAEQLVENLEQAFDPSKYTDEYRANLMKVIKAKMRGKKIKLEEPEGEPVDSGVLDLMSRLKASLEQGGGKKTARGKRGATTRARAPKAGKRKSA
jgi:DNA end-binding protein Ku